MFEASPSVINPGEVTYLRWSVSRSNIVTIDNGIGNIALNGTIPVTPSITTFYTLTARNSAGTSSARTQIIVSTLPVPTTPTTQPTRPIINSFYASRNSILSGESADLSWDVSQATLVTITNIGTVSSHQQITIYPANTTTYTLTATNSSGTSSQSVIVTIRSPQNPLVKSITLFAIPAESGSLIKGGSYYAFQENICTGDDSLNLAHRAFLSFDISSIPRTAIIQEAILDCNNYSKTGNPTYVISYWGNMGALEFYHFQYDRLTEQNYSLAYNRAAKLTENGRFVYYPPPSWVWDVKNAEDGDPIIQNLVQMGLARCQFRIQFFTSTNWNSISDAFCFDNASLTIKYTLP